MEIADSTSQYNVAQRPAFWQCPLMMDAPLPLSPFELAAGELRAPGVARRELGRSVAADAPAPTADSAQGKLRRLPLRMTPKAIRRPTPNGRDIYKWQRR
jgi:hypothetical protein